MEKMSKQRANVLAFIRCAGINGRTFGEIQRFICEMNGLDYDKRVNEISNWERKTYVSKRKYRGYWCTNLCGTGGTFTARREGILSKYCEKIGKKYYIMGDGRVGY